jgi:hypothetical protein
VSKNNMWASHGLDRFCGRPYSVIGPELQVIGRVSEEVGQPIRRTSRPIRLRHFSHARTKLLASKIYIGLINIDFFHIVMQIFWEISRDTTFTTVNQPIGTVS